MTFQLGLQGEIDRAFFTSVLLVLGAFGQDHRVRNELIGSWRQLQGKLLLHIVTASQSFPEGLGGTDHRVPSPRSVL